MKPLTRLACGAALFSVVAVTSCSLPFERPTAAERQATSTRTIYCPAPGEGSPSDLCAAHAAGVGLSTPRETVHVVTCPPSGSPSAPAGCLAHESGVPARSAGTDRLSEPDSDGCRHSIHVEPDGTELHHLNAICPIVYPPEGERVIEVGPPAEPITPAAPVEPGDIPI